MSFYFWKPVSGFSANPTAEEVTFGIDANNLTAIVTGKLHISMFNLFTICMSSCSLEKVYKASNFDF